MKLKVKKIEVNMELQVELTAKEVLPLSIMKPLWSKEVANILKEPFVKTQNNIWLDLFKFCWKQYSTLILRRLDVHGKYNLSVDWGGSIEVW